MTAYHAQYALVGTEVEREVAITVGTGRITAVTPGAPRDPGSTTLEGLTVPGFVNAHSHAFHRTLRGRTHGSGDFWSWREGMYRVAERFTPETYEELAIGVYAEMLAAGFTTVGEFHYLHHERGGRRYAEPNEMGWALVRAAAAVGIRLVLIDVCYLRGSFAAPAEGVQLRFSDGDVTVWADRVGELARELDGAPLASLAVAAHSVRAVPPADLARLGDVAHRLGCPLHIHLSEQPAENSATVAATGRSPTALLEHAGLLEPTTSAIHATHLEPADIVALGRGEVSIVACPTTERDLGDGLGPFSELAAAGATLALGTDSHAAIDPFEEMRGIELHDRMRLGRRGLHSPAALLAAATTGGARSLGVDAGMIAPGRLADLVTVRPGSWGLAGTDIAQVDHVAFSASAGDVSDVVVHGRHVVKAGQIDAVDGALERLGSVVDGLWRGAFS